MPPNTPVPNPTNTQDVAPKSTPVRDEPSRVPGIDEVLRVGRRAFIPAGAFATVALGLWLGLAYALLVAAGLVLVLAIMALWESLQTLHEPDTRDNPFEDLANAVGAEDEQKRYLLRALKDLEFERSVGKISEDDYRELTETYRAKAKLVLQRVEQTLAPSRVQADKLVHDYLQTQGLMPDAGKTSHETGVASKPETRVAQKMADPSHKPVGICNACKTPNDVDARFCKHCGLPMGSSDPISTGA